MPPRHRRLVFTRRVLDGRAVRLGYRLDGGPSPDVALEEQLVLPDGPARPGTDAAAARALELLHLIAGVSYWKTSCPDDIAFECEPPAPEDADFVEELWLNGLGELFHVNGLAPVRARLPRGPGRRAVESPRGDGPPLVLLGGGKDSAVSVEILREALAPVALSVNAPPWIARAAAASGVPHRVVERKLPRELFALNEEGALNGHVPVTAIVLAIAQLVAVRDGHAAVVASNERSASEGTTIDGRVVNHQWSKGLDHERAWQAACTRAGDSAASFSLIRPLSELHVARCFATHPRWFGSVTSCNRNFALRPGAAPERWCGTCPKCVFVFLVTTPWLDAAARATLFGRDFLDDAATLPVVEELLGISGHKPFECVGTPDEVAAALWLCHERGLHARSPALALFRDRVLPAIDGPALVARSLAPSPDHLVPPPFDELLDAYLRSRRR